jgi:ribA/ribD-fused uncharacterized protein
MSETQNKEFEYIYFWSEHDEKYGCFSQWYKSDFVEDGHIYNCCEQYMMVKKAQLFNCHGDNLQILKMILIETSAKKMKSLGRKVKNFNEEKWNNWKYNIVLSANRLKFSQNDKILDTLLSTDGNIVAEASPYDNIWGIGVRAKKGLTKSGWKGENLLGQVLMQVRSELI